MRPKTCKEWRQEQGSNAKPSFFCFAAGRADTRAFCAVGQAPVARLACEERPTYCKGIPAAGRSCLYLKTSTCKKLRCTQSWRPDGVRAASHSAAVLDRNDGTAVDHRLEA